MPGIRRRGSHRPHRSREVRIGAPAATSALVVLADQLSEALSLVTDVASELVSYLDELPSRRKHFGNRAGACEAQLRTLTRKYAADVDGVLAWAAQARERLTQLDVSEEALTALARTMDELGAQSWPPRRQS